MDEIIAECKMNMGEKSRFRRGIEELRDSQSKTTIFTTIPLPIALNPIAQPLTEEFGSTQDPLEMKCRQVYDFTSTALARFVHLFTLFSPNLLISKGSRGGDH
jgi:hypothetical protein